MPGIRIHFSRVPFVSNDFFYTISFINFNSVADGFRELSCTRALILSAEESRRLRHRFY